MEPVHDKFPRRAGALKRPWRALPTVRPRASKWACALPSTSVTWLKFPASSAWLRELEVPRACFYHLVYSGRGSDLIKEDLDHSETRQVLDLIMDETRALFDAGKPKEILTVDNHADGPYVWMRLKREDPKRAEDVFELLQYNEGNNSGRGIGCISWDGKARRPVLAAARLRQCAGAPILPDLGRPRH